ncbi:PucR family transcriptional regulator [Virgibacillus siamensis]|uniref:PucR family transcriptional regulator n=1 Tax=Virgibacillus siamensis TaxID=480071 RepID=UPI0015892574|nr:helix-turn-helix domain-containing protein [Virgibacillus siamensis]
MIEKLRKIYDSLIFFEDIYPEDTENYNWFLTNDHELIGIAKEELSERDLSLLNALLRPYHITTPEMSAEEKKWHSLLHSNYPITMEADSFRFIYFSFSRHQLEPASFNEAIQAFFAKQIPIIWTNEHEGIIVETDPDEDLSYEQIIDVLMSDLYVKIKFMIGALHDSLAHAKKYYDMLVHAAASTFPHIEKAVISHTEAIPYIVLDQADPQFLEDTASLILGEFRNDEELLKTIEMFFKCNLNISVTAKELYMHRNSLQYRLDKFTDKTGIDIRQFHEAITAYLAILSIKK